MDIEGNQGQAQELYPRILPTQMGELKGHCVTLIGSVCKEDRNGALMIECGQGNVIVVDNKRKADIDSQIQYVEVRGVVSGPTSIHYQEITELNHQSKDNFDFKTYFKMIELTHHEKLRHLFATTE